MTHRSNWDGRALRLFFRLNADLMNYTPLSFRAKRASRIMVRLVTIMEERVARYVAQQAQS